MPEFVSPVAPSPDPESARGPFEALKVGPAFVPPLAAAQASGSDFEAPDAELDPLEEIVFGEHLFL